MLRLLKIVFLTVWFFYLSFWTFLYLNQKSMIYFPSHQDFFKCEKFNDYEKVNFNWTKMYFKSWWDNVIVIYHWNAWSACDRSNLKEFFEKTGYSIAFVEYAWYSNDSYSPSIWLLYWDVTNVKTYLWSKNFKNIIVYWRSIWTWLATYQAKIWKVDKLILVTPFSTFARLISSKYPVYPIKYLLTEDYDNVSNLDNYRNDVLIVHWDIDDVITYKLWKELYDNLKTVKKEFLTIPWKWHNDLQNDKIFYDKIYEFIIK